MDKIELILNKYGISYNGNHNDATQKEIEESLLRGKMPPTPDSIFCFYINYLSPNMKPLKIIDKALFCEKFGLTGFSSKLHPLIFENIQPIISYNKQTDQTSLSFQYFSLSLSIPANKIDELLCYYSSEYAMKKAFNSQTHEESSNTFKKLHQTMIESSIELSKCPLYELRDEVLSVLKQKNIT